MIKGGLKQFGWDCVHWIQLTENRDQLWALVKKGTHRFKKRRVLHGMIKINP
jgi:hypothetical protein